MAKWGDYAAGLLRQPLNFVLMALLARLILVSLDSAAEVAAACNQMAAVAHTDTDDHRRLWVASWTVAQVYPSCEMDLTSLLVELLQQPLCSLSNLAGLLRVGSHG